MDLSKSFWLIGMLLALTACSHLGLGQGASRAEVESGERLIDANYQAMERLLGDNPAQLGITRALLVTTVVDVDALESSSTLGRMMTEQLASRASQLGYPVIELKVRKDLFIKNNAGELLLSRDVQQLAISHDAQAAVVGTYALDHDIAYVTLKLVNLKNHQIMNAVDYIVPRSALNSGTLNGGAVASKPKVFDDPFYH